MRRGLAIEDLGGLLSEPSAAVLATYRRDGTVLLSPVWFRWDGAALETTMAAGDVKLRHIARDPRVVLTVFEPRPPFRGLELRCRANVLRDGVRDARLDIASRFVGPERAAAYVEGHPEDAWLVRMEPGEVRAWDFADIFPVGDG